MNVSEEVIVIGTGCSPSQAKVWSGPINSALIKFGITTINPVAAFLANAGVETGGLKAFTENLNYSAQGLANTWKSRYSVDPKATPKVPNALALQLAKRPEAIANNCYADRMGNGNEASGDGWKYRGQGIFQLTGRANFQAFFKAAGLPEDSDPAIVCEPQSAALSAAWFFKERGCIPLAEKDNISAVVKLINGAVPGAANHGPLRVSRYLAAKRAMRG